MRLQSDRIRSRLTEDIECFDQCNRKRFCMAETFLATHNMLEVPTTTQSLNDNDVAKTNCIFLESTNAMLRFLKFMEKETGLCSGGDIWLNNKIAFSRHLVQDPPRSPIPSRRGGERAGMAFRLKY
ncbi:hypothetical protein QBC34DRAFT_441261, partial [Podospora aff. communis PSN243]